MGDCHFGVSPVNYPDPDTGYHREVSNYNEGYIINPHLPSGPVHPYQLDESIFNFRGAWCTFSVLFYI